MMGSLLRDLQSRSCDRPDLALRLWYLAIALVVIFLAAVLNAALPLRLIDPRWLQLVVQVLLEKGVLPLIALALLYLAVVLNPTSTRLRRRRDRCSRLANWAAIGFGLLIPLQIASSWGSINLASAGQQQQRLQGAAVIASLRQAVSVSTSHQDLEQRLRGLPIARSAPPTAADLALPFPERQQRILAGLQRSEQELAAAGRSAPIPWLALLETTLRNAPTALALAAGYAGFGIGIGGSNSPQSDEVKVYLEGLSRDPAGG